MQSFIDKVVVITGAGSGMGRDYALEFSRLGAKVALNDFNAESLEETVRLLMAKGIGAQRVYAQAFDVSNRAQMFDFAQQVQVQLGAAHVVINNAGISGKGKSVLEMPFEQFAAVMHINFNGVRAWHAGILAPVALQRGSSTGQCFECAGTDWHAWQCRILRLEICGTGLH